MADPWADFSPVNPSGMLSAGNIDLTNRPRVKNADGSISTVRSIGVNFDGKEYLIPTVTDDGRVVSEDEAVKLFKRTGKHLGVFDTPAASTAYAKSLHNDQAAMLEKDPWADFSPVKEEAAPETPFPTTSETMGRMFKSGLTAIPSMVSGMVEGATAPMMAIPNEVRAYAHGKPSPTMEQIRGVAGHLGAAFAPGPAGASERMGEAVQAVPVVGPLAAQVVKGGQKIAAPLATTMVSGAGAITPEQMNTAADTGGAAIANIAAPEIARGGVAVAGKITPSMGKLLKFGPPAAMAVAGHPVAAVKMLMKGALTEHVLKPMGNIAIDHVLERIAARDAEGAAAALARGLEKSPEAAKALASTLEQQANKVAPAGAPTFSPTDGSVEAVAARNAAKHARRASGAVPEPVVAPEASTAIQRPAFVDEAQGVNLPPDTSMPQGYPRGGRSNPGPWEPVDAIPEPYKTPVQPVKGNVKLPTVYTKPGPKVKPAAGESPAAKALAEKQGKVASPDAIRAAFGETPKGSPHSKKGPSGAPLTAAERKAALIKLQQAIAGEQDIFAAFGMEN